MISGSTSNMGLFGAKRNVNLSKWNFLFDAQPTEWISFKPELGRFVYPCYVCRHMFATKTSFVDHVNRRTVILNYNCPECDETLTFYNRCALLLHARKHFSLKEGKVDLKNLNIFVLPIGLAGFPPNPQSIPMLYAEDEDEIEANTYINCQFYSPNTTLAGKDVILFYPKDLIFAQRSSDSNSTRLAMLQVSTTLPRCQFVNFEEYQRLKTLYYFLEENGSNYENITQESDVVVKSEPNENTFTMPVISKIESLNKDAAVNGESYPKCSECQETVTIPMAKHFLAQNLPIDTSLNCESCRFIAPTKCSLQAHTRIHTSTTPYVCPECGKTFDRTELFQQHLDDVCFHLSKQVKFRCPAKRCGKLFSLTATYMSHFENHLNLYYECVECKITYLDLADAQEHCFSNPDRCSLRRIFTCTVCNLPPTEITQTGYKEHIQWHTSDRSKCMYVYVCRSCRASFRSTNTYAVHQLRCAKVVKKVDITGRQWRYIDCKHCAWRVYFVANEITKECKNCLTLNYLPQESQYNESSTTAFKNTNHIPEESAKSKQSSIVGKGNKDNECILCNAVLEPATKTNHLRSCKFSNPVVYVTRYTNEELVQLQISRMNSSSSDVDSLENSTSTENDSSKSSSPSKPDDSSKKRRKRYVFSNRNKRANVTNNANIEDLQAEKPMPFTGTYYCKLCDFSSTVRYDFHAHIVEHRDISTAHQCMECGECFVVKPSLAKHLQHFHFISDIDNYLKENNCYDKKAVKELEETLKNPIVKNKVTEENQCRVCMQKFDNPVELNKHFRVHGMAFLMSNSK